MPLWRNAAIPTRRGTQGRPGRWHRLVKLFLHRGVFLCRRCHDLAYPTERSGEPDRAVIQAGKIKGRLGGNPDVLARFPTRPKGMCARSYARELRRYAEADARIDDAFIAEPTRFK